MSRGGGTLTLAIVVALAAASCGDGEGDGSPSASRAAGRPPSDAVLTIVTPRSGTVIHGSAVELRVRLQGARIVPQTTKEVVPDEGHLHVILDDELISMTEGLRQTISEVAPGSHRITVEFVASDHAPFDPRVVAVTAFEVSP